MNEPEKVIRYVVTHVNVEKTLRVLTRAAQGRHTYATREEAQGWADAIGPDFRRVFGDAADTLKVMPVECWPGHFDPKRTVWGLEDE